jgi:glyoxylate reductase
VVAATRRNVVVANTPDVLTEATAELAFTLMLAAARRIGEGERLVRSGQWTGWALDQLLGVQLAGKTLGVVGFGRIGQAMARRAEGFGMRVIHIGRSGGLPIDELFATADVVSLHCPLTPETRHIVNAHTLGLMKPTAILVNTARGGCVDEPALIDALTAGRIFAAALDVYDKEPAPMAASRGIDPRLLSCPRLTLAPHVGSATTETRTAMAQLCADAVIEVLSGRRPTNIVNPEVYA